MRNNGLILQISPTALVKANTQRCDRQTKIRDKAEWFHLIPSIGNTYSLLLGF